MFEALKPHFYFLNFYAIPTFLVSAVIFATGLFVFIQNRKAPANVSFFLLCLGINLWLFGISIMYCAKDPKIALQWYRWVVFLGVVNIAPLVYRFSVSWLGLQEKQKRLVQLSYLLTPVFYLLGILTPYGIPRVHQYFWGFYPVYGIAGRIFLGFFYTYFLLSFYNFFSELKRETSMLKKKQINLVGIAFLISVIGSVDYIPKIVPVSLYPFGYLPVLIWILIVAYVIVRYKVMDIQTVIHKTIMWSVTSSLFAVPVVLLSYLGKGWLVTMNPFLFCALIFGLVSLLAFYIRLVQPKIDHVFQRRRRDLAQVFEKFTDELTHLKELNEFSRHIVETIRNAFYVNEISLLLSQDEASPFLCVTRVPEGEIPFLDRNNGFLNWLEKKEAVVLREYLDMDPKYETVKEEAKKYFDDVNAQVCVPLGLEQHLIGIINIGKKANLKRFDVAEINFLSDLRKTAAIALSNTLRSIAMQENLRQWNVELEKKVEERTAELKETQAQLIQAEKLASIGTLAGGIAHEINNPLTAVLTNVQMIKFSGEVQDAESLDLIEEGAKRCQAIIKKLMRYARKSEEVDTFEHVDVNKVIRTVCDFLGYQLKQENVEIDLKLQEVGIIDGIPNELEQVFINLILNSRDAIRATGRVGKIVIKTQGDNGFVRIEVSDNGNGIKKEHLARIFDPFYTTKDVGEGTGLGLTVSTGIVEKHLGKISVTSQEGKGTTFTIQFPKAKTKTLSGKS